MKRFLSLFLVIVMLSCMAPTAFAVSNEATVAADKLYALGLFSGTGTDKNGNPIYDLDRAPTRHEAVTMLVRLLGKETEAKTGTWDLPFTDVASWAKPYVGYAYANGLTSGTSATSFGGNAPISASQYLTFILRALGYDSSVDFQWNKAWELSDAIGLTSREYTAATTRFTRGDVAKISYNALSTLYNASTVTLAAKLLEDGVIEPGAALIAGVMPGTTTVTMDLEIEGGVCGFRHDALKELFPQMASWSYIEMLPHLVADIDTCIARSDQMSSLLYVGKSDYQREAWFRALYDDPSVVFEGRIELLVFDELTNLCAFAVGTPETIDRKICRFTFTVCDYDFYHVYQACKKDFEDLPYIAPEDVAASGAKYFYSNTTSWGPTNGTLQDYLRHQVCGLLGPGRVPVRYSYFSHSIGEYPLSAQHIDVEKEWTAYLLLDEYENRIGYTYSVYTKP